MKRFVAILIVACLLTVSCCACAKQNADTPGGDVTTGTPTTTTSPSQNGKLFNVLTGDYSLNEADGNHPVGIMVPNDGITRGNQSGIDKADFILESETEGSIPRLLAVFGNAASVPDKFGPIRSARSPFVRMARGIDAIYCHAGGSGTALQTLKTGVLNHFDALADSKTFWRDPELKSVMDTVHSVATSGQKLAERIKKANIANTATKQPFAFGTVVGKQSAQKVQLKTTASQTVSFIYDAATKTYGKNLGALDNCKPHLSLEDKQIKVTNVVVLYAEKYVEFKTAKNTLYDFRTGSGKGYMISGGTVRPIKFTLKDDGFTLLEEDGSPAKFAVGKTYMCLADQTLADKFSVS
ncbi:MAG: DUF3048 domain-containing protein [Clostridia bacterium]|nr:DUF3048 domain-containing protein [Clostridia bacterium]